LATSSRAVKQADAYLESGETIAATAKGQPAGAIESQSPAPIQFVLTDRRLFGYRVGVTTGRDLGKPEFSTPLAQIASISTSKKYKIATLGVPVFEVNLDLTDGSVLTFASSGVGIQRVRQLAEAIESAIPKNHE